jgi:DNA-binding response OmpR family regulator
MKRVLIVEDDTATSLILKRAVNGSFGYDTCQAKNGLEALRLLKRIDFDGILLDITMPKMDGIETLEKIRHELKMESIPVIICSAISQKKEVNQTLHLNVFDYILKPFTYSKLLERLSNFAEYIESQDVGERNVKLKEKILLIVNNSAKEKEIQNYFKDKYELLITDNAVDAFYICKKERPRVVVIDESVNETDLYVLSKKINDPNNPNRSVIYFGTNIDIEFGGMYNSPIKKLEELEEIIIKRNSEPALIPS